MQNTKELINNEIGATIVYVAIILGILVMFTALAIDVNHLYGVRNELQNAADAGALAGASKLFSEDDGTVEADTARQEGARIGSANKSGNQSILISVDGCGPGVECDVEVGHWSFTNRAFTRSEDDQQYIGWETTSAKDLDTIEAFINSVKVTAKRADTPSFFAKIFGYDKFFVSTDAVAYIGYAGTLQPLELNQPIAICEEFIIEIDDDSYICNKGRMINSGNNVTSANSGGWTNFTQDPCTQPTPNNQEGSGMLDMVCKGNKYSVDVGVGMGVKGGEAQPAMDKLHGCWDTETNQNVHWNMTLPVVDCQGQNNPQGCLTVVGSVNLNVIWITENGNDPQYNNVPENMTAPDFAPWQCVGTDKESRIACWDNFVDHFELESAEYLPNTIYFLPDCTLHKPKGLTGGHHFGILAKIPKLVE